VCKTDYLGIHEKRYKYLRNTNKKGWIEEEEKERMIEKVLSILKEK